MLQRRSAVGLLVALGACRAAAADLRPPPPASRAATSAVPRSAWIACFVRTEPPAPKGAPPVCGTARFGADSAGWGTLVYRVPVDRLMSWTIPPEDSTVVVGYRTYAYEGALPPRVTFGGRPAACTTDAEGTEVCTASDHTMELMGDGVVRGDSIIGRWQINCGFCADEGTFVFRRQR